jgi:TolB-like protein/Flp pilus assembly protein TadD
VIVEPHDIFGDDVNIAARLEGIGEPGGICVSSSVYAHVRGKLAIEFTDLGELSLRNISRPVRAYAVVRQEPGSATHVANASFGALSAPHLSMVVLPFTNLGGDPEQEYFVEGVTESLTTDLSRIAGSFVIGRHTAFTYKGKRVDLRQIGRELNVRYVIEGSVQHNGMRLRVNVQLIDAAGGNHLWAERFEKPIADLFEMQDEIVTRLAYTLGSQLVVAEARRAERSPNPDAMDLTFQGQAWLYKGSNPEHLAKARAFFERALAIDHRSVGALVGMGYLDMMIGAALLTDDRAARFAAAETNLTKAISLAPDNAIAHLNLAPVYIFTNRAVEGIAECEHALRLDRNVAAAHAGIGIAKFFLGRSAETEGHVLEALRLSPRDLRAHQWLHIVGAAKFQLGVYDEAINWLRRGIEANPNFPTAHFSLAAALALHGEVDEAKATATRALALNPSYTIRRLCAIKSSENPTYLAGHERLCEGLRLAGILEG